MEKMFEAIGEAINLGLGYLIIILSIGLAAIVLVVAGKKAIS